MIICSYITLGSYLTVNVTDRYTNVTLPSATVTGILSYNDFESQQAGNPLTWGHDQFYWYNSSEYIYPLWPGLVLYYPMEFYNLFDYINDYTWNGYSSVQTGSKFSVTGGYIGYSEIYDNEFTNSTPFDVTGSYGSISLFFKTNTTDQELVSYRKDDKLDTIYNLSSKSYSKWDKLINYYPFDNYNISDDFAGSNDGTLYNGVIGSNGYLGYGMSFDGINDYITIPETNVTDLTSCAWVKRNDNRADKGIVGRFTGTLSSSAWGIQTYSTNQYLCAIVNVSDRIVNAYTGAVDVVGWHHICCSYNSSSGNIKTYYDGVAKGTGTIQGGLNDISSNVEIGTYAGGVYTKYFNGSIDEVRIYNKSLTQAEITALYNNNTRGAYDIQDDWNMTEDTLHYDGSKLICYPGSDCHSCIKPIVYGDYEYNITDILEGSSTNTGACYNGSTGFNITKEEMFINTYYIDCYFNTTGNIVCEYNNYTYKNSIHSDNVLSDNKWHNFIITGNDSHLLMYIDNVKQTDYDTNGIFWDDFVYTTQGLWIGSQFLTGNNLTGYIDEVRVYNKSLNTDEINNLYHNITLGAYNLSKDWLYTSRPLVPFYCPYDTCGAFTLNLPSFHFIGTNRISKTLCLKNLSNYYNDNVLDAHYNLYSTVNLINNACINSSWLQGIISNFTIHYDYLQLFNITLSATNYSTKIYQYNLTNTSTSIMRNLGYMGLDQCSLFTTPTINLTFWLENYPSIMYNASVEANIYVYGDTYNKTYTFTLSGNSSYILCKSDENITADVYFKYYYDGGYYHRFYQNGQTYTDNLIKYYLYNFNSTTGNSDLVITLRRYDNYNPYTNIYTKLQRYYPSEDVWRTVQMDKSGDYGITSYNIIQKNQDYRLLFYDKDNNLLKQTDSLKFVCDSITGVCSITQILSPYTGTTTTKDLQTNITFSNSTQNITVTFNDPTSVTTSVRVVVTKETSKTTYTICDTTKIGASGTITCDVNGYIGDVLVSVYSTASPEKPFESEWIKIYTVGLYQILGEQEGSIWSFMITTTLVFMMGLISPVAGVIATVIAMFIIMYLGMVSIIGNTFVVIIAVLGIIIGIIIKK